MRYVIIGRSVAGIAAARSIRQNSPSSDIIMISGENVPAYYRPMLPYLLAGQKSTQEISYPADPLEGLAVSLILGTATGVNAKKEEVLLASGERVAFDALLIATGGGALKPAIPGIDASGVFPLRTMAQAMQIREAAEGADSVVVIGGGLVGIKAALALRESRNENAPRQVTVIEMLPEILNGRLDRRGARMVRAAVEQEGITVLTRAKVARIEQAGGRAAGVKLTSGRTIRGGLVIVAAGVKPNIAFLKKSGVKTGKGVLVDESLRTNAPGVFAAGDVVEGRDLITGAKVVSGLWSNAFEMGRIAGANMTGKKIAYSGLLPVMNASEIAGVPFISVGRIEPDKGKYETISREDDNGYWKLVLDRNFLVGAVFVGDLARAGIYTNLIKNRIPLSAVRSKVKNRAAGYADFAARR